MEEQTSQDAKNTAKNKPTSNQQDQNQQGLSRASSSIPGRPVVRAWASPFSLMRVFMDDLDRLVQGLGSSGNTLAAGSAASTRSAQIWIPAVEALERDGQFVIRVDVPGLDREQLTVEIDDDRVIIAGEREDEDEDRGSNYYRRERSYGRFTRVIPLPAGVDGSKATAAFDNGVLEISMPAPQRPESRKLEIQGGQATSTSNEQTSTQEPAGSSAGSKAESKH